MSVHIEAIKKLSNFTVGRVCYVNAPMYHALAEEVEHLCEGLCLECVREGKSNLLEPCSTKTHASLE